MTALAVTLGIVAAVAVLAACTLAALGGLALLRQNAALTKALLARPEPSVRAFVAPATADAFDLPGADDIAPVQRPAPAPPPADEAVVHTFGHDTEALDLNGVPPSWMSEDTYERVLSERAIHSLRRPVEERA